ncbi:MAG: tetratricopeptide repeat protein [Gemmatimonadales bacterium]
MADSATGLERSVDPNAYSPIAGGNRGSADRTARAAIQPIDMRAGHQADIATLIQLAKQNLETGNDADAEELFRKALEIGDRVLGAEDPQLNFLLNDLTRLYLRQSAFASAEPLLLRLLEMKRSKGDDHPEVATVLASLANVRQALGHHESAEQLWRRVLDIRDRTLAPNHFAIATALERLGDACAARGKTREALAAFQRALIIRERTLGGEHPSVRVAQERIADLELQASEDSLEPMSQEPLPARERFRLLSGESAPLASPVTAVEAPVTIPHEKIPANAVKKATAVIDHPFADLPATVTEASAQAEPVGSQIPDTKNATPFQLPAAMIAAAAQYPAPAPKTTEPAQPSAATSQTPEAMPYRPILETIREELENPYEGVSLAERTNEFLASAFAAIGRKEVIAASVVVVIALLGFAVVTGAHAFGEVSQAAATAPAASLESRARAVSAPTQALATNALSLSAAAGTNGGTKAPIAHTSPAEEKSSSKKVAEKKPEGKAIAIPTIQKGVLASLDSVASRTATSASRENDVYSVQPAQIPGGNRRSSFADPEQSTGPVRARLIGDLPIPRVPSQVSDIEGEVRVQFNVDADGVPVMSTVTVLRSPHPLLTNAVTRVIPGMRFEPARGGPERKPVADVVQIGFQFARGRE